MSNVKLIHTLNDGDLIVEDGTICTDGGLESAVYLSLFGGNSDGVDWWGNISENDPDKRYISETQRILVSLPLTVNNLRRLVKAIERDLAWLNAVKHINVEIVGVNRVNMVVKLTGDQDVEFAVNWGASDDCIADPELTRTDATPPPEPVPELDIESTTLDGSFSVGSHNLTVSETKLITAVESNNGVLNSYTVGDPFNTTSDDSISFDFTSGTGSVRASFYTDNHFYVITYNSGDSDSVLKQYTWDGVNLSSVAGPVDTTSLKTVLGATSVFAQHAVLHKNKLYLSAAANITGSTVNYLLEISTLSGDPMNLQYDNKFLIWENIDYESSAGAHNLRLFDITADDSLLLFDNSSTPNMYKLILDTDDISNTTNPSEFVSLGTLSQVPTVCYIDNNHLYVGTTFDIYRYNLTFVL